MIFISGSFAQSNVYVSSLHPGEDFTHELQTSINNLRAGSSIIFDSVAGKVYEIGPIHLKSNINVIIQDGVIIRALSGAYPGTGACVFKLWECENVNIYGLGSGGKIIMQIDEYENGQWRHCINLRGCKNINIENLTLSESGGDGIYINKTGNCDSSYWRNCEDIYIHNVICDGNARQGISIISAKNVNIDECTFRNTGQYNDRDGDSEPAPRGPYAGIDFEPNNTCERLQNINITNCYFENNKRYGIVFGFGKLSGSSPPTSITIDNCSISKSPYGIYFATKSSSLTGSINIKNSSVSDTYEYAIVFQRWPYSDVKMNITFDNINIDNPTSDAKKAAILIRNTNGDYENSGLTFNGLNITNNISKKSILFEDNDSNVFRRLYQAFKDLF